jgi:tubulin---tyrosine ligase
VISGPNFGRNSTTLFSLSSGTIGGAMEAATFRKRAVALSYAYFSSDVPVQIVDEASAVSVRVVEYLMSAWGHDVELYTVNVPLVTGVAETKILFTPCLENYWSSGSAFEEVSSASVDDGENTSANAARKDEAEAAAQSEREIRDQVDGGQLGKNESAIKHARHKHRTFKWAPRFGDVHRSVEDSEPGNDGWAIRQGYTR